MKSSHSDRALCCTRISSALSVWMWLIVRANLAPSEHSAWAPPHKVLSCPRVCCRCQSHCGSFSTAASRDSQVIRREIAEALSHSFPVHSLTIQMESPAEQDPDCLFCEDPQD